MSTVSEPLAALLRSGREDWNQRFQTARREHPTLDPEAFSAFVRTGIDPLVRLVHRVDPDEAFAVAAAAWDIALLLVAKQLAGPGAKQPWINEVWATLLPALASRIVTAPAKMIGSLSNAAHHLGATHGARPGEWVARMIRIGEAFPEIDAGTLLRAGQVAAWRSGMAHFREGALGIAETLPPELGRVCVEAPPDDDWTALLGRLRSDRFHCPGRRDEASGERLRAGAFRGFGGLFVAPPRVAAWNDQILVASGEDVWLLTADGFGATFHRAAPEHFREGAGSRRTELPVAKDAGPVTSVARVSTMQAVTAELTHAVILFSPESQPGGPSR